MDELWTDERIREAMLRRVSHQHYMTIYDARMVAHEMRDDYEQRLCHLVDVPPSLVLTDEVVEFIRRAVMDTYGTPWSFTNGDTERLYRETLAWLDNAALAAGGSDGQ